jgi:CcmD family protein
MRHLMKNLGLALAGVVASVALAAAQGAAQPPAQDGFRPFVPGQGAVEQLPATPLVFTAYAIVWVVLVVYVWSVWRRLGRVEADLRSVQQKGGAGRRP